MTGTDEAKATFTEIADSIRSKTGKTATMKITDMASEIDGIVLGITPSGTKRITSNGTYDITDYQSVVVQIDLSSLSYTLNITNNPVTISMGTSSTNRSTQKYTMSSSTTPYSKSVTNSSVSNLPVKASAIAYTSDPTTNSKSTYPGFYIDSKSSLESFLKTYFKSNISTDYSGTVKIVIRFWMSSRDNDEGYFYTELPSASGIMYRYWGKSLLTPNFNGGQATITVSGKTVSSVTFQYFYNGSSVNFGDVIIMSDSPAGSTSTSFKIFPYDITSITIS